MRAIFERIDTDGDGLLTMSELRTGLRRLRIPYSQSSIVKFMAAVDTNGDGVISYAEFRAAVLTHQERLHRAFRELSGGPEGRIGARELEKWAGKMGLPLSHDEVKALVDMLDSTGRGHVELSEFCDFFFTHIGDVHAQGLFEAWLKSSPLSALAVPDAPQEALPSAITLASGATAGMVSRTLTAPADRIKTLLQAAATAARPAPAAAAAAVGAVRTYATAAAGAATVTVSPLHGAAAGLALPGGGLAVEMEGAGRVRRPPPPIRHPFGGGGVLGSLTHAARRVQGPSSSGLTGLGMLPDEEVPQPRRVVSGGGGVAPASVSATSGPRVAPLHVTSFRSAVRAILADGGLPAFWRGNGVNLMKVAPEMATRFWAYEQLKVAVCEDPYNISLGERFAAGAAAGAISQAAIYPLEVAKTRMALSARGQYRGVQDCIASCVRTEGPWALYRGMAASLIGIIPYSGVDLALFSLLKDTYMARYPGREPGVATLLVCGATSTTCAQIVTYPLQLVRTRLQAQGMEGRPPVYHGIVDCVAKTLAADGVRGLYRGILPNFMKSVPAMAISFAVYETVKRALTSTWRAQGSPSFF